MSQTTQTNGDIHHSGTIEELLHANMTLYKSLIEYLDNSTDWGAKKIRIIIDKKNSILYIIDNGVGANKTGLKRLSVLSDSVGSSNNRNGLFCKGSKLAGAYITQLYKNKNNEVKYEGTDLIKSVFDKTIYAISKTEDYNKLTDVPISHINIDFSKAIKTGKYENDPEHSNTITKKIWEKLSIDPNGTGMIIRIPFDPMVFNEAVGGIQSNKLSESLRLQIGSMYHQYFEDPSFDIEIELVNSVDIICDNDGIVDINIDRENNEKFSIVPFDKLHYKEIPEKHKKNITWRQYVNKIDVNDIKMITKWLREEDGIECDIEINGELAVEKSEGDMIKIEEGYKKSDIGQKLAYSSDWDTYDSPTLEKTIGKQKLNKTDKAKLNTRRYRRNKKIVFEKQTKNVTSGDFSKRDIVTNIREDVSYTAEGSDKYMGLLVQKSELNEKLIDKKILNSLDWATKKFTEYIIKEVSNNTSSINVASGGGASGGGASGGGASGGGASVASGGGSTNSSSSISSISVASATVASGGGSNTNTSSNRKELLGGASAYFGVSSVTAGGGGSSKIGGGTNNNNNQSSLLVEESNNKITPKKVSRSSNDANYLSKKEFMRCLGIWVSNSNTDNKPLDKAIEKVFKEYNIGENPFEKYSTQLTPEQKNKMFKSNYQILTMEQKVGIVKKQIITEYLNDTDNVRGGGEFYKAYKKVSGNN